MVVKDVSTCWNFTLAMIRHAELLKEAIQRWIFSYPAFHFVLPSLDDWKELHQVADILEASRLFLII
ncbi:hypothetical protein C8J56DRAFT_791465 [Mycena floridula]|nr:hypothetical protein C8J56DRAFT_791465 [Mycena floridula]